MDKVWKSYKYKNLTFLAISGLIAFFLSKYEPFHELLLGLGDFGYIGAFIIASPFPDEIGVSLMGISKLKTYQFLLIAFALNILAVFLIISASSFIKP